MRFKKSLSLLIIFTMLLSLVNVGFAVTESTNDELKSLGKEEATKLIRELQAKSRQNEESKSSKKDLELYLERKARINEEGKFEEYKPMDEVRVIVTTEGISVAEYANNMSLGIEELTKNEIQSIETEAIDVQKSIKSSISNKRIKIKYRHSYTTALNGFSADVMYEDIEEIEKLPGVKNVRIANVYYPDMKTAHEFTNAETVWSEEFGAYKGEGMVIAIVDTGVNWDHPNFQAPADLTKAKYKEGEGKYTDKVVEGYNWADMNDEVRDFSDSQHGVHVAGIAAGKGEELLGVAPEAQIIAEKVFGNDVESSGAYTDDIVAAINDAVKKGADVINMSLGSVAGYVLPDDPEQIAITNAVDAGVIVAVSAGNSAYSTDGYYYPYAENPDIGIVGSPGVGTDTIQVAASNNIIKLFQHYVSVNGEEQAVGYGVDDWSALGEDLELIAIGGDKLGSPSDYEGIDVKGKVVLVSRGVHTFVDKTEWAAAEGAIGIICYDHENPGSSFYYDQGGWSIPFMMIHKAEGLALEDLLEDGPISISVTYKESGIDPRTGQPTDFSSWGPTPDLQFKPEIMAPGGKILSSEGKDDYVYESGTSMSAPYVAGGMALIAQAMKEKGITSGTREFVETAKILAMNAAEPVLNDEGFEFQPRLQGSGMMKLDRAITTPVRVTGEDGKAAISLKEIGDETTFTINVKNDSNNPVTYNVSGTVQTDYLYYGVINTLISLYMDASEAALTFDQNKITVPANGEVDIITTLNVDDASYNSFIEGFIYLEPENEDIPQVSLPYFGFYGNWDEPKIVDKPIYTGEAYYEEYYTGTTLLVSGWDFEEDEETLYYMNDPYDSSTYFFSPNGDYWMDEIYPQLAFLRNAKEMNIVIRDEAGNKIRRVAGDEYIRKPNVSYGYPTCYVRDNWKWDGKIFNAQGKYVIAPDGDYSVEINTVIDYDGAGWQSLTMPVTIDATEPELTITSIETTGEDGTYKLTWDVTEEGTGIEGYLIAVNGELLSEDFISGKVTKYDLELPLMNNIIELLAVDKAGNTGYAYIFVNNTTVTDSTAPIITVEHPADFLFTSNNYVEVNGTVKDQLPVDLRIRLEKQGVSYLPIGEDDSTIVSLDRIGLELYDFYEFLPIPEEGLYVIRYYAKDAKVSDDARDNVTEFSNVLVCDKTAPTVQNVTFSNGFYTDDAAYVTISGSAYDNGIGYNLSINGDNIIKVMAETVDNPEVETLRSFEYGIKLVDGVNFIKIVATDLIDEGAANKTDLTFDAVVDLESGTVDIDGDVISLTDIDDLGYFEPQLTISNDTDLITSDDYVTVTGSVYACVYAQPVNVTMNGEVTSLFKNKFNYIWSLEEGDNQLTIIAQDSIGGIDSKTLTAFSDQTAPIIEITSPEKNEIRLEDVSKIKIEGTVSDNLSGYTLFINDEETVVSNDKTENMFSESVSLVKGKNIITVYAVDSLNNSSGKIKIIVNVTESEDQNSGGSSGGSSGATDDTDTRIVSVTVLSAAKTIKDDEGNIELVFEEGTFDKKAKVTVDVVEEEGVVEPKSSEQITRISDVYDFTSSVVTFNNPVLVKIKYNKSKLNGINEERLGVYTLNEETNTWEYVGGKVDKNNGVVEVELNHFSKYTVMASTRTFADIANHWAKHEVEVMAARQIVNGRDGVNYDPQGTITKAEFTKTLVNLLGLQQEKYTGTFTDIVDKWYTGYVEAALKAGVITATEHTFNPDAAITREEMAVMVANTIKYADETKATVVELAFEDKDQISEAAIEAVAIAFNNGIINGRTTTTFVPQGTATRAEAATMIYRLLQTLNRL